ncbi:MAG TPA: alanine racemase [Burkholderiaceae bacterium]|nr:alanine racemase [Burkholderiaceae bacterium]
MALTLGPWLKGFPPDAPPCKPADIVARRWNLLAGDLPLPLAALDRDALAHNLQWMQGYARSQGLDLAPHGKTTMSPELFARQLAAGAWGITFANVFQLRVGVAAGVRRALIANQLVQDVELAALQALRALHADLRVVFLVDSLPQLSRIEAWSRAHETKAFEVLLEIGVPGGRTGVREHGDALVLARALRASTAVRLVGIECYEGLGATGDSARDAEYAAALMQRLTDVAQACDRESLFESEEVIVSAGGSGIFDLVAARMRLSLQRPVRGLLRSGCYVTHDHGQYQRLVQRVIERCGCSEGLRPALQLWSCVQSVPEPGLAVLTAGRRDVGFDMGLPQPIGFAAVGARRLETPDPAWRITALNDQHAYLRFDAGSAVGLAVGDRVVLGISHPCTTFDKWHWMPIVNAALDVVDAVTIHF